MILKLLTNHLNTIDGEKNSADPVITHIFNREIDLIIKETGKSYVS